jgi:hypothetical protein
LQLAGYLVDRRRHLALKDLGGTGKRLVECWFDGRLADHDETCLAGQEFLGRIIQLLAGQGPAAEPLGNDADVRAVHPLDDVRFAVLLVDHGRVVRAGHLLARVLDGVQHCLRSRDSRVRCGVDDHILLLSHDISLSLGCS